MPFDAVFLHSIIGEISKVCLGAKIDKIFLPEKDEVVLSLRVTGGNIRLLVSANANNPRIQTTKIVKENPNVPPMFCMLLRKHLIGGKLICITQLSFERAVKLEFQTINDFFEEDTKYLVLEVLGRQSNIILLDSSMRIIDSLKKIDISEKATRQIIPGVSYRLPDTQNKIDPIIDFDIIEENLLKCNDEIVCDKVLMGNIMGISPLIARELVYIAGIPLDEKFSQLRASHKKTLILTVKDFFECVKTYNTAPYMLFDGEKPKDFTLIECGQYASKYACVKQEGFSQMLDSYYGTREKIESIKQKSGQIYRFVNTSLDKTKNKIAHQVQELETSKDREKFRIYGELITAHIAQIEKGAKYAMLQNYYDENCDEIKIPLDEKKNAAQNAQNYFKKYQKLKTAEKMLTNQIGIGKREIEYLSNVKEFLEMCQCEKDIDEIRNELVDGGYLRNKGKKNKKAVISKPLEFTTDDGFKILVGRNNVQNDLLTTKIAVKSDYWLHALDMPGSHVILVTQGKEPSDTALVQAGGLAAFYSKGKNDDKVPVTYTLVKNVKKPNGSKPGFVIFKTSNTMYVKPKNR